jgi:hypothetical protein
MKLKWQKDAEGSFTALDGKLLIEMQPWAPKGEPGKWLLAAGEVACYIRTKQDAIDFAQAFVDVLEKVGSLA